MAFGLPRWHIRRKPGRRLLVVLILYGAFGFICLSGLVFVGVYQVGGSLGLWKGPPPSTLAGVTERLGSPNLAVQTRALRDLNKYPPDRENREVAEALKKLMQRPYVAGITEDATKALGAWGRPEDAEALAKVLSETAGRRTSPWRRAAIDSLGELGGPLASELLAGCLVHADDRPASAAGLEKIGPCAEKAVGTVLKEPQADEATRLQAVRILGRIGTEESLPALRRVIDRDGPGLLAEQAGEGGKAIEARLSAVKGR